MIRIYKSQNNGEFIIQTDATEMSFFMQELSSAILQCLDKMSGDEDHTLTSILSNAFPIAFKLQGYKAETVHVRQVLTSGYALPDESQLIADIGTIAAREKREIEVDSNQLEGFKTENTNTGKPRKEPRW
jgi:hypothetical protein